METESSANPQQQNGPSMLAEQCTERHPDSHNHQGNEHGESYWQRHQQQATFSDSGVRVHVHIRWRTLLATAIAGLAFLCIAGYLFYHQLLGLQLAAQRPCVCDVTMLQKTMSNITQSFMMAAVNASLTVAPVLMSNFYYDCHDAKTQVMSLNSSLNQCNVQHYQQGNNLSMCAGQLRATRVSLGRTKTGLNTRARVLYSAKTECEEQLSSSKMKNRNLEKKLAKSKKSCVAGKKWLKTQQQGLRADLAARDRKIARLMKECHERETLFASLQKSFLAQQQQRVLPHLDAMYMHARNLAIIEDTFSRLTVWVTNRQARGICSAALSQFGGARLDLVKSLKAVNFQFPQEDVPVTADKLIISDTGSLPFTRHICDEPAISFIQKGTPSYINSLESLLNSVKLTHAENTLSSLKELLALEDYITRLETLLRDTDSRSICQDMLNDIARWRINKLSKVYIGHKELNVTDALYARLRVDPTKIGNSSRSFFKRLWCPQAVLFTIKNKREDVEEEYQIDSEKKDIVGLGFIVLVIVSCIILIVVLYTFLVLVWGFGHVVCAIKNLTVAVIMSISLLIEFSLL